MVTSAEILKQAQALLKPGEKIGISEEEHIANEKSFIKSNNNAVPVPTINDRNALLAKLKEIQYQPAKGASRVPWVETLAITAAKPRNLKPLKENEDVKRESLFQSQATELVAEGFRRLRVMRVPCNRPNDFLAEMYKEDSQMQKIRGRIAEEQKRVKIIEERKRNQQNAKFGKAIGVERAKERAKAKSKVLGEIDGWKSKKTGDEREKSLDSILTGAKKKEGKGAKGKGKGKGKAKSGGGKGGGKGSKGKGRGKGVRKGGKK